MHLYSELSIFYLLTHSNTCKNIKKKNTAGMVDTPLLHCCMRPAENSPAQDYGAGTCADRIFGQ